MKEMLILILYILAIWGGLELLVWISERKGH